MSRRWRHFAVSMVGAGFALFLRHRLDAFSNFQDWFDNGSPGGWWASLTGALTAATLCWGLEERIKRMAFGEAVILCWLSSMCLAMLLHGVGVFGLPLVSYSLTMLASTFGLYATRSLDEEENRKQLARAFKSYVAPELVDELESKPHLLRTESTKKDLTIFFSDIQNFTSLSEKLPAEELMSTLNRYFSGVTEIIFKYGGTLDKYMGDGVMAFWGAPTESVNHRRLATLAALEVDQFSNDFFVTLSGKTGLSLSTRIGLNSGVAHVGNFGSPMRFTYTVVGDEANLAARVEPLNNRYGTKILVTEATAETCDGLPMQFVDEVRVKGRSKAVRLFTVLPRTTSSKEAEAISAKYERAFSTYQSGRFVEAGELFNGLVQEFPFFLPAKEMQSRCSQFASAPPENWDGCYRFTEKKE